MTDSAADPRRFRLRAFEADWLAPLAASADSPLDALLEREAHRWIVLGRRAGYFADADADVDADEPDLDAAEFERGLGEAQEDLTPARREFLELVLFADDATWRSRLQQALDVAAMVTGAPGKEIDGGLLDAVRWSVDGAVSDIAPEPRLPAHWRAGDAQELARIRPWAGERLEQAGEARAALVAVADRLVAGTQVGSPRPVPDAEARAARIHRQLLRAVPALAPLTVRDEGAWLIVELAQPQDTAMLELRPPAGSPEVPVWASLATGRADIRDLSFEPDVATIVAWTVDQARCGLVLDYPQSFVHTALAGVGHPVPVVGGRRADDRLDLWIEASPLGRVTATIDAEASLGAVADLTWTTSEGPGRLLIAQAGSTEGRTLGHAELPSSVVATGLEHAELAVHASLATLPHEIGLLVASVRASLTSAARALWLQLLHGHPSEAAVLAALGEADRP